MGDSGKIINLLEPFEQLSKDISSTEAFAADVITAVMSLTCLLARVDDACKQPNVPYSKLPVHDLKVCKMNDCMPMQLWLMLVAEIVTVTQKGERSTEIAAECGGNG